MKSPEYLSEQAALAQLLRDSIRLGEGAPAMADRILRSDWLRDRIRRERTLAAALALAEPVPSGTASGVITLPTDNPKDAA